jgi:NAD(P)H dehydrogenase (quinone)
LGCARPRTDRALQRIAISAAAAISSVEQVTRLSVLNASADSLGINQASM